MLSWAYPRPEPGEMLLDSELAQQADSQRAPASIISLGEVVVSESYSQSQMLTLELPCGTLGNDFTSPAKQIRLKFKNCDGLIPQEQKHLNVYNSTNQYQASIFSLNPGQYSTDYIYLREGDNIINIETRNEDSHSPVVKKFIIRRVVEHNDSSSVF